MNTITSYLTNDHKFCDKLFLKTIIEIDNNNWQLAKSKFNKFLFTIKMHINIEENFLFKKFEKITSIKNGPTYIMRLEHNKINKILQNMIINIKNQQKINFKLNYNNLLNIIQIHSKKEEEILYPMLDEKMEEQAPILLVKMKQIKNNKQIKNFY